jgi:DNA-binding transcriptional regulator LsrR (DeoR family)
MYYNQKYKQQEIADRLHLSRPKVSRLLKQAREHGIVQISVISPDGNFTKTEEALEIKFGLREAVLVDIEGYDAGVIKRQLGAAAAHYLHRTASPGELIGVTWGTTLQTMVDAVQPKPVEDIHIVQALGGVGPPEAKAHASDISHRLARLLDGRLTLLPAPGIVSSEEAKQVLLSDRQVRGALDLFSKLNTLYVGLGALNTNPVLEKGRGELPSGFHKEIMGSEAVGDIALHFFDAKGDEVETSLKRCVIGITPKEIKKVDTVVGIAGGPEKTDVIRGALNGRYIDVLITDQQTAAELLD